MSSSSQARTTAVLGGLALVLAIAVAVVVALVFAKGDSKESAQPPATVTQSVIMKPSTTSTATEIYTPPPPATPAGSAVVESGPCLESEARSFGTAANGQSLVCAYMGADGGYRWVQHAPTSGEVHNLGEPCNHPDDTVAVDPSGRAIMCSGPNGTWTDGP